MADEAGRTTLTEDEVIAQANHRGFPNLIVACPTHGMVRDKDKKLIDCQKPECQEGIEARKAEVRQAVAPTAEDKATWREGLIGRAKPK